MFPVIEFWQIKHILEKMRAMASLTYVWVMVDHKLPKRLQRSPKLKTSNWFFGQYF